jgi:hypothetical protein
MASFWLTKRALLEALKLTEGLPQYTMVCFNGSSEVKGDKEYTVVKIDVNGKQKTVKEEFHKLLLKNEDNLSLEFDKALEKAKKQ